MESTNKEIKCKDVLGDYVGRILTCVGNLTKTNDTFEMTVLLEQISLLSEAALKSINHK